MGLAAVLQKVMYGSHITHCQSLVRHQQQPGKVSGIESPNQQEPDRSRNVILPETRQWSELASDASLTATKLRSPVLRTGLSGKQKEAGEQEEGYLKHWVSSSRVYVHYHLSIHCLAAFSGNF